MPRCVDFRRWASTRWPGCVSRSRLCPLEGARPDDRGDRGRDRSRGGRRHRARAVDGPVLGVRRGRVRRGARLRDPALDGGASVRHRPPVATLLASLAAHGGALATLFFLVSGESNPGVLFIDLETIAEHEAPIPQSEPRLAGGATKRASTGLGRPAGRVAARSGPAAPSATPLHSPRTPSASPEPERAQEREAAQAPPETPQQTEPAVAMVPARETPPDVAVRSEVNASPAGPRVNPGGAVGAPAAGPPEPGGVRRGAPDPGTSGGTGGTGGGTAVASIGPAGGAPGGEIAR